MVEEEFFFFFFRSKDPERDIISLYGGGENTGMDPGRPARFRQPANHGCCAVRSVVGLPVL